MPAPPVRWILFVSLGLLTAWLPATVHGQQLVTGRLTDAETGRPIIGARVFLLDSQVSVATDFNGRYFLPVPPDFDRHRDPRVSVMSIGHQRQYGLAETVSGRDFLVRHLDLPLRRYVRPISCERTARYTEPRVVFPEQPLGRFHSPVAFGLSAPTLALLLAVISGIALPGFLLALGILEREEERRQRRRVRRG